MLFADGNSGAVRPRQLCPGGRGAGRQPATATCNAPTLTLRGTTPHTVLDVIFEGVLQAWLFHGALGTVVTSNLHPNSVAREKNLGRQVPAPSLHHPRSFQDDLRCALRHTLNVLRSPAGLWIPAGLNLSQNAGKDAAMLFYSTPQAPVKAVPGRPGGQTRSPQNMPGEQRQTT
jgi:hypothetical protein